MDNILFSVIIPVYNRENCVHLAIDSVRKQEYENWELILIDDGSTDQTDLVCREYAEQDLRIRYFRKENGGVSSARNLGIQNSQGEYILFLDSDDSLSSECMSVLQHQIAKRAITPDMICFGTCSASGRWVPTDEDAPAYILKDKIRKDFLPTHINLYPQNKHFILNYIWNKCYSTEFIKDNSLLFDESRRTWEDGLFVVNCLDKAKDLLLIPEVLHMGCADDSVEHLSGKFYDSQIPIYIQDETDFKTRFETEYDFSSEHYCHQNLNTLNVLFTSAFDSLRMDASPLMETALKSPIVHHWVISIDSQNRYERYLHTCVIRRKYHWMIFFYQIHSIKQLIMRRIRR